MKLNENYRRLSRNYLFSEVEKRTQAFREKHPEKELIRLGIGDVTLPLAGPCVQALIRAAQEMQHSESFRGYGPEGGYPFLRSAVKAHYASFGVSLSEEEIFISSGAKDDLAGILDLFSCDNTVLTADPVYPVYADTNITGGRRIEWMRADEKNGFLPMPDETRRADLIYLCSPNNPTGAAYPRSALRAWVQYAKRWGAVLIFDAAYEAYISESDVPHSIYEIEGAKECAVEICSLSKTAGFTGLRCGYTVVPKALRCSGVSLNAMWARRKAISTNGVAYVVQRAAEAVFTDEGQKCTKSAVRYYKHNAQVIADALRDVGAACTGGENSPYIWMKCPAGMDSWEFFDYLLSTAGVIGTPGSGFGSAGEGYFRLTGFSGAKQTEKAAVRMKQAIRAVQ